MHSLGSNTTSKGESSLFTSGSSSISGPLQTLNSSLKRIRLNEGGHESMDSIEQEWGAFDLAELDESERTLETDSPTTKKPRKENEDLEREDMEDMDDFMPSEGQSTTKPAIDEERHILTEKTNPDRNTSSSSSSNVTMTSTAFKSQLNMTHKSKTSKPPKPARSHNGMEDVFSHEQVRNWSEVRIKTWENKRTNTEGFYYRFVDPTEGQQNGPWSSKSTKEFMVRLDEWKARGIRIGTSWGIFSMRVSHKAGYQCSSYYRKLLETKKLMDPAYAWEGGKLVMVNKSSGGEMAISGLSERWDTEEVKEIEANVIRWIKEYHSNTGGRPVATKAKRVDHGPSVSGSIAGTSSRSGTASLFRSTTEAPRVKATTASAMPKAMSIRPNKQQPTDESEMIPVIDINDKLAEYSSFMKKSSSTSSEPGRIRQSISLTVAGTVTSSSAPPARAIVPIEVRKAPLATHTVKGQTGLSLFWKNIRPVRVECPDVPKYLIPKDVDLRPTWAHKIQPFAELNSAPVEGSIYKEVSKMIDFDWTSLSEGFEEPIGDIQGVLADPPWNFIVEDGRNDGACRLTPVEFEEIMEKALELMPNGIVSIWTHKSILPEVVNIMQSLGCRYVENLVWYKMALNNSNLNRASPYFRSSKEILLMFKKGDGFDIRHQRTADVIMDFEKPTSSWIEEDFTEPKPESAFEMMEIMLPDARYTPENGRGRLLEIWAKRSQERRPGWFSVHELKHPAMPETEDKQEPEPDVNLMLELSVEQELEMKNDAEKDEDTDSIDEALLTKIANDMELDLDE